MFLPKPGGAACAVLVALIPAFSRAEGAPCPPRGGPAEVVRCAIASSPDVAEARRGLESIAMRRSATDVALPSLPTLAVSAAGRTSADDAAFNAYLTLSQEFAIGGQRAARLDVSEAEGGAQARRVVVASHEAAAQALTAYVELVAAQERGVLADRLRSLAATLTSFAQERVRGELLSAVEGRALEAEANRLVSDASVADGSLGVARATWQQLFDGAADPSGTLLPIAIPEEPVLALVTRAVGLRGEVAAEEEEVKVLRARAVVLDRQGTPNLTVSLQAQRDGFRENVFGVGISVPIPMPGDAWPTTSRQATEQRALATQAEAQVEAIRRRVKLEVVRAHAEWTARRATAAVISPALVASTHADLETITRQLQAGMLPPRDALLSRRSLLDLLDRDLEARRALALASVELVRAAGLPWPGATP